MSSSSSFFFTVYKAGRGLNSFFIFFKDFFEIRWNCCAENELTFFFFWQRKKRICECSDLVEFVGKGCRQCNDANWYLLLVVFFLLFVTPFLSSVLCSRYSVTVEELIDGSLVSFGTPSELETRKLRWKTQVGERQRSKCNLGYRGGNGIWCV